MVRGTATGIVTGINLTQPANRSDPAPPAAAALISPVTFAGPATATFGGYLLACPQLLVSKAKSSKLWTRSFDNRSGQAKMCAHTHEPSESQWTSCVITDSLLTVSHLNNRCLKLLVPTALPCPFGKHCLLLDMDWCGMLQTAASQQQQLPRL